MTSRDRNIEADDDLISIRDVLSFCWRAKWLIGTTTAASVAISVAYALLATPIFRAEAVLTEVHSESVGGNVAGTLGGLASLAGLNISGSGSSGNEALAILKSRALTERFIERFQLIDVLYEGTEDPPSVWRAVTYFRDSIVEVRQDTRSGLITVSMEWSDAKAAAEWANKYVDLANEAVRLRKVEDAERNILFLNKQIASTNIVELQTVLYNLVEAETKKLMLASAREEFAFAVVDPAVEPEIRVRPKRTMIVMVGVAAGMLLGVLLALFQQALPVGSRLGGATRPQ